MTAHEKQEQKIISAGEIRYAQFLQDIGFSHTQLMTPHTGTLKKMFHASREHFVILAMREILSNSKFEDIY